MIMDLQTRKISFVQEFLRVQNEEIVSGLESFLRKKNAEMFEENLTPMSLELFNQDIDNALNDSQEEKIVSANELKNRIKKWS